MLISLTFTLLHSIPIFHSLSIVLLMLEFQTSFKLLNSFSEGTLYVSLCTCMRVFFFLKMYLSCFWLHWVFVAVQRLSLVAASGQGTAFELWCSGFSLWQLLLLQSVGSRLLRLP